MIDKPKHIPNSLWNDYQKLPVTSDSLQHRLIYNHGISHAWRELYKRVSTSEVEQIYQYFIEVEMEKDQVLPQSEYVSDMKELAEIAHQCSLVVKRIDRKYGRYLKDYKLLQINDIGHILPLLSHNSEIRKELKRLNIKPQTTPISTYLDFISDTARDLSEINYFTLDIYKNKGNSNRLYVIRKLALLFTELFDTPLTGTCARFAGAILADEIGNESVKDALRKYKL